MYYGYITSCKLKPILYCQVKWLSDVLINNTRTYTHIECLSYLVTEIPDFLTHFQTQYLRKWVAYNSWQMKETPLFFYPISNLRYVEIYRDVCLFISSIIVHIRLSPMSATIVSLQPYSVTLRDNSEIKYERMTCVCVWIGCVYT